MIKCVEIIKKLVKEPIIVSRIQHFEADFLWKVSLKILNSRLILKTFTRERGELYNTYCVFVLAEVAGVLVFPY